MVGRTDTTVERQIDTLDPRLYDDPWDTYRWLRTQPGLYYDEANDLYVAARHEDVSTISRNQERYSAAEGVRPRVPTDMSIISMDDPEHTRQRRIISKGFTPRKVRELSDHMHEVCNQVIDEIEAVGEIDFVEDFAIHLPLIIIAELMGLDPDQRMKLYRWSDDMMAGDSGTGEEDDPITQAAAEVEAAGDLSDDELLMFLTLLIVAGNETTRNANLAKTELRVAFQELFRRLPDIGILDGATPERGNSSLVISLAHLPAVFTPSHAV